MKRRRVLAAGSAVVAIVALATWLRRADTLLDSTPVAPEREVGEPLAPAQTEAPSAPARAAPDASAADGDAGLALDLELASEQAMMESAREALRSEPRRTLALVEAADRRFGAQNEARRVLEIEALVALQKIGLSHSKAEQFYRTFPNSPSAREVERRTGYHPRPRGP